MTSFNYQQADLSLNYLLSFVKGSRIEFNAEHMPENVKFSKINPIKPIAQQSAALFGAEFTVDLTTIASSSVENVYLLMQLPAQQISPGEFFAYSDLPALKMINRIDIMFNTYENVIESLTPAIIYLRLLEKYAATGSTEKWSDMANMFLGALNNSVSYTSLPKQTVLLPIPCDLFPLSLDHIFKSDADRMAAVNLYVKVYFNNVDMFSVHSPKYSPNSYVSSADGTVCECALLLEQHMRAADPPRLVAPSTLADFHVASRYSFTMTSQRSIMPKTDYIKMLDDAYINKLYMCMYNPYISSPGVASTFYGNYCYNALENYVNSFVYPQNSIPPSTETILNLRDGTLLNSNDIIVQLVNSSTYVINYGAQTVTVVCANLEWQNLPEDVFFDVGSMLKNADIPVAASVKNMYFYVKPTLYEPTTALNTVTDGSHVGLLEGLYYSADGDWAFYGFANIELRDTLTPEDLFFLKFTLSRPVDVKIATKASVFVTRKYCVWRDPLYMFADLDRSIKYGAADIDIVSTNRRTLDTSSTRSDWVSDTIQNYTNRMQSEASVQKYLPATFFSFSARNDEKGYIDTVLTSYELNYIVNFFDADTNTRIAPSTARQKIINSFYGTVEIRVDFVYMLVRFLVYSAKQVYAYTANTTLYNNIINDYYNGTLPRQIDTKMVVFNQQLAEKRRKRAKGVFINM